MRQLRADPRSDGSDQPQEPHCPGRRRFRRRRLHWFLTSECVLRMDSDVARSRTNHLATARQELGSGYDRRGASRSGDHPGPRLGHPHSSRGRHPWRRANASTCGSKPSSAISRPPRNGHRSRGTPEAWRDWWQNPDAESYYFVGKDNISFHAVIWPAMLIGYGEHNLPTNVPANQYVTFKGDKAQQVDGDRKIDRVVCRSPRARRPSICRSHPSCPNKTTPI